jgi:hypothetical protein
MISVHAGETRQQLLDRITKQVLCLLDFFVRGGQLRVELSGTLIERTAQSAAQCVKPRAEQPRLHIRIAAMVARRHNRGRHPEYGNDHDRHSGRPGISCGRDHDGDARNTRSYGRSSKQFPAPRWLCQRPPQSVEA